MKNERSWRGWLVAAMLLGCGWMAWGQTADTNSVTASELVRGGQAVLPGSGAISGLTDASPLARPERAERLQLSQEVKDRIVEFEKLRETYLGQQKEMLRKLRGATDEDRERIRSTLREQREAWLEQARRFRDEAQKRMEELKSQMPDHRDALAPVRERAGEAARDLRDRPRR